MKELLTQYTAYNVWANKLIIDALLKMDETAIDMEIVSSFPSLRATVYHTWSAEYIWLQRLQLAERPVWIEAEFKGSFAEACTEWQRASEALQLFVEKQYDDRSFEHVLQYYDRKKVPHKKPVWEVLTHISNHSSYHRGQLVTMMRQAGAKEIPGMDFVLFQRRK